MSLSGVGAYFRKRTQDSRDFGGLRIRGIFVFSEDKVSFLFQFREERKVGVRWGGRFGLSVADVGWRGPGRG